MQTDNTLTRQRLTAILKKAGHRASKWHRSGQIRGWGHSSPGYELQVVEENERYAWVGATVRQRRYAKVGSDVVGFRLSYVTYDSLANDRREEQREAGMAALRETLTKAGVRFEEKDGELYIPAK